MRHGRVRFLAAALLALLFSLAACCNGGSVRAKGGAAPSPAASSAPAAVWRGAEFDETAAEYDHAVGADLSHLSEGYAAFRAENEKRLKVQIIHGEEKYNYDLPGDGTVTVCPLNMGDGDYTFRVMENIGGDRYAPIWKAERRVTLSDEFQPFLRPSVMVRYDADSDCVAEAAQLTGGRETDVEQVAAVYAYLVEEVEYDYEKAKSVQRGYLPDPDATLEEKKGICFDYAALAAAMLRSQGIPCKLITGYVEPDGVYHAWNEIYLKDRGWITAKIKAGGRDWKHVDITFASNGVPASKTDNEKLYTKRYTY